MASHMEFLFGVLQDLGNDELKNFQWFLKQADMVEGFPAIPKCQLEDADRQDTVDQMVQTYGLPGALQITAEILKKISRNDLVELFSKHESNKVATDVGETSDNTEGSCIQQPLLPQSPPPDAEAGDLLVQVPKPPQPITSYQRLLQSNLQNKFMCISEGSSKQKDKKLLDDIYTELYIIDRNSIDNRQHEFKHIEMTSRKPEETERSIKHNDIFKHPSGKNIPVRTVLTIGIAGIGKTFLVNKYILDWAEGRANQDVHLTFPFTFRQLNLLKGRRFRFAELIHKSIREMKDIQEEALNYIFTKLQASGNTNYDKSKFKVLFVLDGLDESRLQLDFSYKEECSIDEPLLVNELLAYLIKGKLLPSARVWITTRPAASNQIPLDFADVVTELRGFTDLQKEEYFRKRFTEEEVADRIISHIKTQRSLHIMCHIPVFCWITTSVLKQMLKEQDERKEIPQTLTEMYTKFLVFQMKQTAEKYDTNKNFKIIQSLAKLAFHQLQRGNLIFYATDLKNSGINLSEASVYSGVFTQIFKEEDGLNEDKMFCFVHLSIHEFLAAVFVVLSLFNDREDVMAEPKTLLQHLQMRFRKASAKEVCMKAVDKALQSPNGHLDLFLRFLLGLSLKSNQDLLQGLLKQTGSSTKTNQQLVEYIKKKIRENPSPERCINLFNCLSEMNDCSLVEEIQHYLRTRSLSTVNLSPTQWSALVYVLLSSEQDLDVFDLKKYSKSEDVLMRMLPLVKASTRALLNQCELSHLSCEALASVLSSKSSSLRELDMGHNNLQNSGVKLLSVGLETPDCRLESLRLSSCEVTGEGCAALTSALSFNSSHQKELDVNSSDATKKLKLKAPRKQFHTSPRYLKEACCQNVGQYCSLKELDLSNNNLQNEGLVLLSAGLESPHCRLKTLRLSSCNLSERGCECLVLILSSKSFSLSELDLSNNDLQDSGVQLLSDGLESPNCRLKTLRLSGCLVTEKGCAPLSSALIFNPFHLRELDLSYNHPGDSGVKLLSARLEDPQCKLDTLSVDNCGEFRILPGLRKYACKLELDPNTAHKSIALSQDNRQATMVRVYQPYPDHPERFENRFQVLCTNGLTGRCYWEVEWKGPTTVGVTYRGICRKGRKDDSMLGRNDKSWCFDCNKSTAWHNNKFTVTSVVSYRNRPNRVAVYLDWPAGTLSFYGVCPDTLIHLHTFSTTFTESVYPALRVVGTYSFALLCMC